MIRVLHLIDSDADFQTERSVAHLSGQFGGIAAETRQLGKAGHWRNGFEAVRALRKIDKIELVHAWGEKAMTAAALGWRGPLIYSPGGTVTRRTTGWVRAVMQYRAIQVVAASASVRRAMVTAGVPLERCHLIRPGVDFSKVRGRRDLELRRTLGLADNDVVLLAIGESTVAGNHRLAVWACSILHVLDPKYRLLLWGRGSETEKVKAFADELNAPRLLVSAEKHLGKRLEFEQLLPATDYGLVTASGAVPTLPIATTMAAGLPMISTVTYTASELLEDRHTAVMVQKNSPRLLAQRILGLRDDAALQWSISDMARTEAFEYFSLTRFRHQWQSVYHQSAEGKAVTVPEQAAGAGLRFHGRG